ncbi:MAG TPA: CHAD domain-containing protein [Opitutaceae bacterium]
MKRGQLQAIRRRVPKTGDPLGHLADSLHANWRRYLKRLKRCRAKITKRAIHRSRVQTRRLFSQLDLLEGFIPANELKKARRPLKRHHALFRDIRDTQVQLAIVDDSIGRFVGAPAFAGWLQRKEVRVGGKARAALKRIKTKRLGQRLAAFEKKLMRCGRRMNKARASQMLRTSVVRMFDRVVDLDRKVDGKQPRTIHRVRVALKRFVYMIEALPESISGMTDHRLRAMRDYIAKLGAIQDVEVLLGGLKKFARKPGSLKVSVDAMFMEFSRRREKLIQEYLQSRSELSRLKPAF